MGIFQRFVINVLVILQQLLTTDVRSIEMQRLDDEDTTTIVAHESHHLADFGSPVTEEMIEWISTVLNDATIRSR